MYRGPKNESVQILYSRTKQDSERIAKQFHEEGVLGFDMEWPWNDWKKSDLQNKIGLIQLASETKIALFHIGLHVGKTTDDIIAPSLKKIIEDPKIGKLGVGVLNADFARLRRYFGLHPKGAVELSHLHRLVKFGNWKPEMVSTKMVSLARLVEDHLGHPLYKGDVRTSNWSKPLSQDQINYAAGDAYAGFMLYHCMNYKRLKMKPPPPMPVHAETYLAYKLSGVIPLHLDAKAEDGSVMTSEKFFRVDMTDTATSSKAKAKEAKKPKHVEPKLPKELVDLTSQLLYQKLLVHRINEAQKLGLPVYRVTTNPVLIALSLQRPTTLVELSAIKGIGNKQQKTYGEAWLDIISGSASAIPQLAKTPNTDEVQDVPVDPPTTPRREYKRGRRRGTQSSESSVAFATPPQRAPILHTGLSFTLADTKLSPGEDDSDDTLPSIDFGDIETDLKRKRAESPAKAPDGPEPPAYNIASEATLPEQAVESESRSPNPALASSLLTPRMRIARNQLQALSKRVTRKLVNRASNAPPIVSERTLSLIIVRAPQTQEELDCIPGIDSFILACQRTQTDLLKNIIKFAPPR